MATRTTLILSRFRFHLTTTRRDVERQLLAEEAAIHAFTGSPNDPSWLEQTEIMELLGAEPSGNVSPRQASEFISEAVAKVETWMHHIEQELSLAGDQLLDEHRAAREAAAGTGRFRVDALTPIDVLGLYILLPDLR